MAITEDEVRAAEARMAARLGEHGGKARSEGKAAAARNNGRKGGRPQERGGVAAGPHWRTGVLLVDSRLGLRNLYGNIS
jgi:hypothetical protein